MRTKIIIQSLIAVLTVVFLSSCGPSADQIEAGKIRVAFQNYLTKSLEKRGDDVVALVDKESIQFFANILNLSLNGSQAEVKALRAIDKEMVLNARHQIGKDLLTLTPESFMAYGVNHGWVSAGSVAELGIGKVSIVGTSATGEASLSGKPTGFFVEFHKENDQWKVSLVSFMSTANEVMRKMVARSGLSEEQFIFNVIESGSGKKVSETIWNPIKEETK